MPWPDDDCDGLRRCRDCDEWKPLDEFHVSPRRPSGRGSYCKPCFNLRSKASHAKRAATLGHVIKHREEIPEGTRRCPDCKELKPLEDFPRSRSGRKGRGRYCKPCHNVRGRESKIRSHGGFREYHLRHRYGIGEADFERMLAEQGGVCAICRAPDPQHVDHDHVFGNVRGILCFSCNGGLGQFRDNPLYLTRAVTYLRETGWQRFQIEPGVWRVVPPLRRDAPESNTTL